MSAFLSAAEVNQTRREHSSVESCTLVLITDELLTELLFFVDLTALSRVQAVCQRWKAITNTPFFLRKLCDGYFSGNSHVNSNMQAWLRKRVQLAAHSLDSSASLSRSATVDLGALLTHLGRHYRKEGDYIRSERVVKRALVVLDPLCRDIESQHRKQHHTESATMVVTLNEYSAVLLESNQLPGAQTMARKALALARTTFGPDSLLVADSFKMLAAVYTSAGSGKAIECFNQAIRIKEKILGPDSVGVSGLLVNLAIFCLSSTEMEGMVEEAESLLRRALAIDLQRLGPTHPSVALTLQALAAVHAQKGEEEACISMQRGAVAIQEQSLGPLHPKLADSLLNLSFALAGSFHDDQPHNPLDDGVIERLKEAAQCAQRAVAIAEIRHDYITLRTGYDHLAGVYQDLRDYDEQEKWLIKSIENAIALSSPSSSTSASPSSPSSSKSFLQEGITNYVHFLECHGRTRDAARWLVKNALGELNIAATVSHSHSPTPTPKNSA